MSNIPYIPAGPVGQPRPRPVPPETPELDKQRPIIESDAHKGLVAFLEWLETDATEYKLVLYRYTEPEPVYDLQAVLARYYGLDLKKIDSEREALLDYLRELNQQ